MKTSRILTIIILIATHSVIHANSIEIDLFFNINKVVAEIPGGEHDKIIVNVNEITEHFVCTFKKINDEGNGVNSLSNDQMIKSQLLMQ